MSVELSIIIPGINEFPQNFFTVQSLWSELRDEVDFEILYIDNYCPEFAKQGKQQDRGYERLKSISERNKFLKVFKYEDKLSHWNAKNIGIKNASADILFFLDAHCIVSKNSLVNMFNFYKANHEELNGTLHLPLSYMLERPGLDLIYKLVADIEKGVVHYSFTRYKEDTKPYKVPCMSTCGMMITKDLLVNEMGMWPSELGIYGGGENFINFTLAVLGKDINIFPTNPLFHYAEKRAYHWNHSDYMRNRLIASYIHSGKDFAKITVSNMRGNPTVKNQIFESIIYNESLRSQKKLIEQQTKISISEFVDRWK